MDGRKAGCRVGGWLHVDQGCRFRSELCAIAGVSARADAHLKHRQRGYAGICKIWAGQLPSLFCCSLTMLCVLYLPTPRCTAAWAGQLPCLMLFPDHAGQLPCLMLLPV